jgi:magnesium-transporting ATPase (P-type)
VKQEARNILWVIIAATALFSGICGIFVNGWKKIIEAISIVGVAIIILLITAYADYMKDQRFVKLQGLVKDENITVIRGKYNATHRVSVWSLVVGDVVLLETGQRVPADCIIISAVDLRVDEEPEDDNVQ